MNYTPIIRSMKVKWREVLRRQIGRKLRSSLLNTCANVASYAKKKKLSQKTMKKKEKKKKKEKRK
jgi:hypothetical protein